MTVLLSLPVELLRQILADLDPSSLRKTSRVSHLLHTFAEPLQYTTVGHTPHPRNWLLPLLSALLSSPSLARHIRSITFWYWAERYPTPANCALFSATAASLNIPDLGWWDDAQALFLLHLVPGVQQLSLNDTPLLTAHLEHTLATPIAELPFQSLTRFTSIAAVSLTLLLALMRLPAIRRVSVLMPYTDTPHHPTPITARISAFAGQSTVTHLALHTGNTPNALLQLILAVPRQLTSLSYMYDREYGTISNTPPLHTLLAPLAPSLHSLSVGGLYALGVPEPLEVLIGPLQHWRALSTLNCSFPALVGPRHTASRRLVDVLPPGVRRLFVWRRDERAGMVKAREHWGVWAMTEMLEELLRGREMHALTVNTCARVYVEAKGARSEGWVNQYEEEVVGRLVLAVGTRRCRVVCF